MSFWCILPSYVLNVDRQLLLKEKGNITNCLIEVTNGTDWLAYVTEPVSQDSQPSDSHSHLSPMMIYGRSAVDRSTFIRAIFPSNAAQLLGRSIKHAGINKASKKHRQITSTSNLPSHDIQVHVIEIKHFKCVRNRDTRERTPRAQRPRSQTILQIPVDSTCWQILRTGGFERHPDH